MGASATYTANNLFLNLDVKLPSLNMDSLQVSMDTLRFDLDKGYCKAVLQTTGFSSPHISAKINARMDLERLMKAVGYQSIAMRGKLDLEAEVSGKYMKGLNPASLRKKDTVVLSIPKFKIHSALQDGYFKFASMPEALNQISFSLDAKCPDSNYKKASVRISDLNAEFLQSFIKGSASVTNATDMPVEAVVVRSGQDPIVVNLDISSPEPAQPGEGPGPFHSKP